MDCKHFIERIKGLPDAWERLAASKKPVCIYGTGDACERILEQFERRGIVCAGIFASDDFLRGGREFCGFEVTSLARLEERFGDITVCCAFGSQLPGVMEQIERVAGRHELVFPDLPVAGEELFAREGLLSRAEELEKVCAQLADGLSAETLFSVLEFKLTGDISVLRRVFTGYDESFAELMSPRAGDCFADLGAYNGDTAEGFIAACPDYGYIWAFEPDVKSFRKCVKRHLHRDNMTFVNACAWSRDEQLCFSQSAGRQSQITGQGRPAAARSLDSVLGGRRCDIIKFDVEGAEREALLGARETIGRCLPRMTVSAYHRPYDLIELPLMISELGGYHIYMRQPPYYPAWDTCVYAIGCPGGDKNEKFS